MKLSLFWKKLIIALCIASFLCAPLKVAKAANLTEMSVGLGSKKPDNVTSYTINFKPAQTATLKKINFVFTRASDSPNKPATLDLTNASLNNLTGLSWGNWNLDTSLGSNGNLSLTYDTGEQVTAGNAISVLLGNIKTPELGDCTVTGSIYDICYLTISTYSDSGDTLVDTGGVTYQIEDTPSLTFNISGVAASTPTNGITTTVATDPDNINFGSLLIRQPVYAAQQLFASTTAPGGYSVTMTLDGYIQGLEPANQITPFLPLNGAWNSPQPWTSPNGPSNSDSGWIGANTSDGRIDQDLGLTNIWSAGNGAGKFGPVSSTPHEVMFSSGRDRDGTSAYLTYGIEVSEKQPPDSYVGTINYDITTTY